MPTSKKAGLLGPSENDFRYRWEAGLFALRTSSSCEFDGHASRAAVVVTVAGRPLILFAPLAWADLNGSPRGSPIPRDGVWGIADDRPVRAAGKKEIHLLKTANQALIRE